MITLSDFKKRVWSHYRLHARSMPWRETADPYAILVSEIMLQQTQVERVKEKYLAFLKKFPTVDALAQTKIGDVLRAWQGLGYNRRALNLKKAAEEIVARYGGEVPRTVAELDTLPGIGHATASAIAVYSYNLPVAYVETNIRTVFIHHFFPKARRVSDEKILHFVEMALDTENPREWYSALMDYGAYLKREVGNSSRRAKAYAKQSTFKGSRRELRGKILKMLSAGSAGLADLKKAIGEDERVVEVLKDLVEEGFIRQKKNLFQLSE